MPYRVVHTECLRAESVAPGPGQLAVILQTPCTLWKGQGARTVSLKAGDILFADAQVDNLSVAIARHLSGPFYESDLRLGVGVITRQVLVAPTWGRGRETIERGIDRWLNDNTAFAFMERTSEGPEPNPIEAGVLNGLILRLRNRLKLTLH